MVLPIVDKLLTFINHPKPLGVLTLAMLVYAFTTYLVIQYSYDNTDRLERAILSVRDTCFSKVTVSEVKRSK